MNRHKNPKATDAMEDGDGSVNINIDCDHSEVRPVKNIFIRIFKKCTLCKKRGGLSMKKIVKCKVCKVTVHNKCLSKMIGREKYNLNNDDENNEHSVHDFEGNHKTYHKNNQEPYHHTLNDDDDQPNTKSDFDTSVENATLTNLNNKTYSYVIYEESDVDNKCDSETFVENSFNSLPMDNIEFEEFIDDNKCDLETFVENSFNSIPIANIACEELNVYNKCDFETCVETSFNSLPMDNIEFEEFIDDNRSNSNKLEDFASDCTTTNNIIPIEEDCDKLVKKEYASTTVNNLTWEESNKDNKYDSETFVDNSYNSLPINHTTSNELNVDNRSNSNKPEEFTSDCTTTNNIIPIEQKKRRPGKNNRAKMKALKDMNERQRLIEYLALTKSNVDDKSNCNKFVKKEYASTTVNNLTREDSNKDKSDKYHENAINSTPINRIIKNNHEIKSLGKNNRAWLQSNMNETDERQKSNENRSDGSIHVDKRSDCDQFPPNKYDCASTSQINNYNTNRREPKEYYRKRFRRHSLERQTSRENNTYKKPNSNNRSDCVEHVENAYDSTTRNSRNLVTCKESNRDNKSDRIKFMKNASAPVNNVNNNKPKTMKRDKNNRVKWSRYESESKSDDYNRTY